MAKSAQDIMMTFIKLDKSGKTPVYVQLYEEISKGILTGMLKAGDRMPATRLLAREFTIARNSVVQAYEQLILEGYIHSITGAGTFVAQIPESPRSGLTRAQAKLASKPAPETLKPLQPKALPYLEYIKNDCGPELFFPFQTSVPALDNFPFKVWAKIAADIYRNIGKLYLGYDHGQGYLPLRSAIADYLRINRSINCSPEQIVVVNGSRQAIHLIAELFAKKNGKCWMEDPGYTGAKSALTKFGAEICPIPISEKGIDLDYAISKYPNADLAYVTPSHQFPMGITMPLEERLRLLNYAEKHRMLIIEDDYDSEFRYDGRPVAALKGIDTSGNVLYLGTFSKILFPALRIGYMVLPDEQLANTFAMLKAMTDRQNPLIDQAILAEFIQAGHLNRHLRKMRLEYKKGQDDLIQLLNQYLAGRFTLSTAKAGMHFIITFTEPEDANRLKNQSNALGLTLLPIDHLSLQFPYEKSFLIGFTGFSFAQMEQGVKLIKKIIG